MTPGPGPELLLVLSQDDACGRIAVDINAFVEFDLSVSKSLRDFVRASPHQRPRNAAAGRITLTKPKPK